MDKLQHRLDTGDEGWSPLTLGRKRLYVIVFRSDTTAGRRFDLVLMVLIIGSVAAVLADSVQSIHARYGRTLFILEWVFTGLFTIEYLLRLIVVRRQLAYATSFFGIVDLLTLLPSYLSLLIPGSQSLIVIRALRLLRVFRILKLPAYLEEARYLRVALRSARRKITVFVFTVLMLVLIVGSLMYLVEGPDNGFDNIPISIYWAIVTLTTVGYGDLAPQTPAGRALASVVMILGYGIIAVPTGIVTAELVTMGQGQGLVPAPDASPRCCPRCRADRHDADANYCKRCGADLDAQGVTPSL